MIKEITFDEIYPIWRNLLWPTRESKIESNSAMCFLGSYELYNMSTKPTFFGYFANNSLIGVNSGHMCSGFQYRSRGLYVMEQYRGMGIGRELLLATINQAKKENAIMCWSYPRQSSWKTYKSSGFQLITDWEKSETSDNNAYCVLSL